MDLKAVVCGVGGQGVLYLARIIYEVATIRGVKVLGSETHGMSQRGGSVTSHLKLGEYSSPMVRRGTTDLLLSLKAEETAANLTFLRRGAAIVMNAPDRFRLGSEVEKALEESGISVASLDATSLAMQLGSAACTNLIVLARAVHLERFPCTPDQLRDAVRAVTLPERLDMNLGAIDASLNGE